MTDYDILRNRVTLGEEQIADLSRIATGQLLQPDTQEALAAVEADRQLADTYDAGIVLTKGYRIDLSQVVTASNGTALDKHPTNRTEEGKK